MRSIAVGFSLVMMIVLCLSGCADVKVPTAQYALTHPLGTKTMVTPGTSKGDVIENWGEPTDVIDMGYDDAGLKKEAWIYEAWFPGTPLDFRHFSRRKKIYFTDDYVTGSEDIEDADKKD
ncbi:hypothetical protein ACFL28_04885 [Candidatus Omnitrophota bacterium]